MGSANPSRGRDRARNVIGIVVLITFVAGAVASMVMIGVDTVTGHAGEQMGELNRPVLDRTLDDGQPTVVLGQVHAHLNAVIWGDATLDPDTGEIIEDVADSLAPDGGAAAALADAARSLGSGDLYDAHDGVAEAERSL